MQELAGVYYCWLPGPITALAHPASACVMLVCVCLGGGGCTPLSAQMVAAVVM
jgi:hypothetical protein